MTDRKTGKIFPPKTKMKVKRTSSTESSASIVSYQGKMVAAKPVHDKPPPESSLFDCVSILCLCLEHNNVVLSKIGKSKGLYFPCAAMSTTDSGYTVAISKCKSMLARSGGGKNYVKFVSPELMAFIRVQVPVKGFFQKLIYYTYILKDPKAPNVCCNDAKLCTWYPINQVAESQINDLWGDDVTAFVGLLMQGGIEKLFHTEYTLKDAQKFWVKEVSKTYQDELLKSAQFTENDCYLLYNEFVQHTFPANNLNKYAFYDYLTKLEFGYKPDEMERLFKAFAFYKENHLYFHEFILGFAAMEKHTPHGGHPGEMRCGYIFRYYDYDCDNNLSYSELYKLIYDILKLKGAVKDGSVENEIDKFYTTMGLDKSDFVTEQQLLKAIGAMAAIRGTSGLFRSPSFIVKQIKLKKLYNFEYEPDQTIKDSRKEKGTCARCKPKKYTLAVHCIKLSHEGTILDPQDIKQENCLQLSKAMRKSSAMVFSLNNPGNKIMDLIHEYFICMKKNKTNDKWTNESNRTDIFDIIIKLCEDVEQIVKNENRCVCVTSPCFVMGDIHGNLPDLLLFEKLLWRRYPNGLDTNQLFLGDYVDRGDHGLECVLYLFAMKSLAPNKFFIIRGNHELRSVQNTFNFPKECLTKFGQKLGTTILNTCNKVFDCLPICATIDDSIFCVHGGIPSSLSKIEEINNCIPCPLPTPENSSAAAWEMLWNDPTEEPCQANNTTGFTDNVKRGTAYFFNETAVDNFLINNDLSHIIRGHELMKQGFQLFINGKVATIFSSSHYCNGTNEAAVAFVELKKIRFIKIETNEP